MIGCFNHCLLCSFHWRTFARAKEKKNRERTGEGRRYPQHSFYILYCHTFLKQQDFIFSCDTQYQRSFFSFNFITEEPSGTEQKRQKVKKKMTEGTLHSLLRYLWIRFSLRSLVWVVLVCDHKHWKQVSVKTHEMGAAIIPLFMELNFETDFQKNYDVTYLYISLFCPKTGRKA